MFLDCCRTPPSKSWLAGDKRSGLTSGLAAIQHTDLLIHYAAAPGHPALDGKGANSPYAAALAKHLLGGKELAELLRDVAGEVMKSTDSEQRPYQTGSLLNSFYLMPVGGSTPTATTVSTSPSSSSVSPQIADKSTTEGDAFLADNAKREGIATTRSGLQYEALKKGNGRRPNNNEIVTVHYVATLPNGTVFDSSVERGLPATFPLQAMISGFSEGIQLMSPGSKYKLFIPSKLAYGVKGSPPVISPNSTLVFEVELLKIEDR